MGMKNNYCKLVDVTDSVVVVQLGTTAGECASLLQKAKTKFICVVDESRKLVGTVSDGDIRRSFSLGHSANGVVDEVMNSKPMVMFENQEFKSLVSTFIEAGIVMVPKITQSGSLVSIFKITEAQDKEEKPNLAFIMAGGRGQRLMPLTKNKPKPLLEISGKPVIIQIIEKLRREGIRKFVISVNYLGEMIKETLKDGANFGVEIEYIKEEQPLGTAGSLGFLDKQADPIIVTNADLICEYNVEEMLSPWSERVDAVIGVRHVEYTLPYGEVQSTNNVVTKIIEKPTTTFNVMAGVNVLSPDALEFIEPNIYLDMPDLIERLVCNNKVVRPVLLGGHWIDVGSHADLDAARNMSREDLL